MESIAKGTELWVHELGSPSAWLKVTGLQSIAPTRTNLVAEVTDYDDEHVRSIAVGVKDTTLSATYNHRENDNGQTEMEAAYADGTERNFRWVYSEQGTPVTRTFAAIVESLGDAPGLKGVIVMSATLKVNSVPST